MTAAVSSDAILYEAIGRVVRITLNRPERRNAFSGTMREELAFALDRAANDPDCRVVVLTGAGAGFCAGGDLDALSKLSEKGDSDGLRRLLEAGGQVVRAIRKMEKPVVAAVDGAAAGAGCSLAAACDVVLASERAVFSLAFVKIGFVPDWGGTFFLPRRIGAARSYRMSSSGEPVDAATAATWGLADRVLPHEGFADSVLAEADRLAAGAPTSLSFQKYLLFHEEIPALDDALAREQEAQLACFETDEFREAMARRAAGTK